MTFTKGEKGLSLVELMIAVGLSSLILIGVSRLSSVLSRFWMQSEQIITIDQLETIIKKEVMSSAYDSAYAQLKTGELLNPMLARCAGVVDDATHLVMNQNLVFCQSGDIHSFVLVKRLQNDKNMPLGLHRRDGYNLMLVSKGGLTQQSLNTTDITGTLYSRSGGVCPGHDLNTQPQHGSLECPFEVRTGFEVQCPGQKWGDVKTCRAASQIRFYYEIRSAKGPNGELLNVPGSKTPMTPRRGTYTWSSEKGDLEIEVTRASSAQFMNCLWIQDDPSKNPQVIGCSSDGALQPPYSPSSKDLEKLNTTGNADSRTTRSNFFLPLIFSTPYRRVMLTKGNCRLRLGFYTFVPSLNANGHPTACLTGVPECVKSPSRPGGKRLSGVYAIVPNGSRFRYYGPLPFDQLTRLFQKSMDIDECPSYRLRVCRVPPSFQGRIRIGLSDGKHCDKEAVSYNNFVASIKYDTQACEIEGINFNDLEDCQ